MKELDSFSYTKVLYLIHNEDTASNLVDIAWQRIPVGDDRIEVFQYLDTFLTRVGPYIQWIQINQEPMGITKYNTTKYSISDIIEWWRALAQFIDSKRSQNVNTLGHLKILSPSISSMVPKPEIVPIVDSMIAFGEQYCDAISLHIYPETVEQGREVVEYFRLKTAHPLACTEFSQAKAGEYTGWFESVNTVWTNTNDFFYGLTNREVMDSAYINPMDSTEWKTFISAAPYTDNFIPEMYAIMDSNCFEFACYAGLWQYGEPVFDWTELVANKTVKQYPYPNNPFYSEYVNLSSSINSGSFQSQCQTSSILKTLDMDKGVKVFPNPSHTEFNIRFEKHVNDVVLFLYDQTGKLILKENNISGYHYTIDGNRLDAGIYYIQLIYKDKSVGEGKIVKYQYGR
jgi:hypothetical protein